MGKPKLTLSNTPPLQVPLRFFFTAPLFGVAAAITMLWHGPDLFMDRWSPAVLATTHLLVLGYIMMVIQGAMLQVMSVLIEGKSPHLNWLSLAMHIFLTIGTLLLAAGFLTESQPLIRLAILSLSSSFTLFFSTITTALITGGARTDAKIRIGIILTTLLVTILSGIGLAAGYGWEEIPLMRQWTDAHLVWGLLGGAGLLLITVSYEVVPMFQLTSPYPEQVRTWLIPTLFSALLLYSLWSNMGGILLAIGYTLYALYTLWLQGTRKRKSPNIIVRFWRYAMISLLAALLLWVAEPLLQTPNLPINYPLLLGVMVIIGFLISAINGMLHKILPFLVWLHLSIRVTESGVSRKLTPNVKKIIPTKFSDAQFIAHLLVLLLLALSTWQPAHFLTPAASLFALSNIILLWNLTTALRVYQQSREEIHLAELEKQA